MPAAARNFLFADHTIESSFFHRHFQPINMSAASPSQTVFSIGYDFHVGNGAPFSDSDNGNVWGITNYKDNTRNQSFTYDSLNRLTSAQNAGTNCAATTVNGKTEYWGNSYGYDAWGNLLQKTVTKCNAENLSVIALANNQLTGYGYDAAGNMTSDPTDSVTSTYDQENRIATATKSGVTTTYTYDDDGNRVEKSSGGAGTLYWYMSPGIVAESDLAGNLQSEYVFFRGGRVARKDFPGLAVSYYFSDHLKTASVITDAAGYIKSESDYYPSGGELQFTNNDSNHYKFTSKERDLETGLAYFGARYYSNGLGRWISADWSATPIPVPYADFGDPQSLNLYTYVRNIPTTKADADGHGWPSWNDVANFVAGAANAYGSDQLLGAGRVEQTTLSGKLGATLGDGAATVSGVLEFGKGLAGEVAGVPLDEVGVGELIQVAATVQVLHGGGVALTGAIHMAKTASESGGNSGSGTETKKPHGNTAGDQPAELYEKHDANGNFEKHGVSQDASKRYTKKEVNGGTVKVTDRGPRKEMLKKERHNVETNPGPKNKERWAGKKKVNGQ